MPGRPQHEGLVGDDQKVLRRVVDEIGQAAQMLVDEAALGARIHHQRVPPGAVALDYAGDFDVADREPLHYTASMVYFLARRPSYQATNPALAQIIAAPIQVIASGSSPKAK